VTVSFRLGLPAMVVAARGRGTVAVVARSAGVECEVGKVRRRQNLFYQVGRRVPMAVSPTCGDCADPG
jgi:hypothetical protein